MADLCIRFSRAAPPTWQEMWKQKSFIDYSEWICRLTHSPFSHVDLLVKEGLLGASNNPDAPVVTGNPSGVAIRPIEYQRFKWRRDVHMQTTEGSANLFEQFCRAQIGKPFDVGALRPTMFLSPDFHKRDWRQPDKWFCAEMIGRAIEVSNLLGYPIPGIKNRITPADLVLLLAPKMNYEVARLPIPGLKLQPWEE